MVKISVHHAALSNLSDMMAVENACFPSDRLKPRQMKYILRKAKAFSLIAKKESKIVAYCTCLTPVSPKPARLYSLAVLPAYRKKGIAGRLLKKVKKILASLNYASCNLEVRIKDKHARNLYEKYGFREFQFLPEYYEDGEDGIRMKCFLKSFKQSGK